MVQIIISGFLLGLTLQSFDRTSIFFISLKPALIMDFGLGCFWRLGFF